MSMNGRVHSETNIHRHARTSVLKEELLVSMVFATTRRAFPFSPRLLVAQLVGLHMVAHCSKPSI